MLILDATNKSLEIDLAAAVTTNELPVVACYADVTSSAMTPGANPTVTTGTTAATIVAAPAASTQRIVKLINVQNADTVPASVTIQYNNNATLRVLGTWSLAPGDTLMYTDSAGFRVIDASGRLRVSDTTLHQPHQLLRAVGGDLSTLAATTTHTSNTTYAQYMGVAERGYNEMTLRLNVTTALGATITWAEVAVMTGTFDIGGAATLTTRGYTDVSGIINSTGVKSIDVSCSGIRSGDHLWLAVGAQTSGTMFKLRGMLADELQTGVFQELATTRPSTMSASTAFGLSSDTYVPFLGYMQGDA